MSVYLCSLYIRVAEQFLEDANIGSTFQHMRGKRMPYTVERKIFKEVGFNLVFFHNFQEAPV